MGEWCEFRDEFLTKWFIKINRQIKNDIKPSVGHWLGWWFFIGWSNKSGMSGHVKSGMGDHLEWNMHFIDFFT
ncbi:hypothetical protein B0680_10505 [Moraxella pluranimalium]|uniref:Uncharacterized protein n=1 Tax=Moraxella pluranimalium TaxID=470453 RepID=A0A1T0CD60_9GAMM|nr:hypothetical protein B0680_10505 [Moraxella pluranimalium]